MKKKKIIIFGAVVLILVTVFFAVGVWFFHSSFYRRFETPAGAAFDVSEFDSLSRERHTFTSDKGQELTGYLYQNEEIPKKGLLIFAHGYGGGGHERYMALLNAFARRGFYVFGYDCSGNDASEGEGVYGLPQGVIDLYHAIDCATSLSEVQGLPVFLAGHSWGGYSVTHVLADHPEVAGIVSFAGFESTSDLFNAWGEDMAGPAARLVTPFMSLYEHMLFGRYHTLRATQAFREYDTKIIIVHSADDDTVPFRSGYGLWEPEFAGDDRFLFIRYEDRGHSGVFLSDEYRAWKASYDEAFDAWRETLPYDSHAEEEKERFEEDRLAYQEEHFDRTWYRNCTDEALVDQIIGFWEG